MPYACTSLSSVKLLSSAVTLTAIILLFMGYNSAVKYTIAVRLIFQQQKNFEFDVQVWGVLRCDLYSGKYDIYICGRIINMYNVFI